MYAFNFKIKKLIIRPAINVGFEYETYFPFSFNYGSTSYFYPGETSNNFNLGLGILFARKNLIFGVSYNHINDRKSKLFNSQFSNPRLTLHGNYLWKPTENISILPGIVYIDEGMNSLASTCLLFKYKYIKIGTAYKSYYWGSEELVGMIGFVNDVISFGYSYDFGISKLASSSGGTHEITAIIKFNCKNDKEKYGISQLYEF
jgi:type IX secretion system PorP/SprF family membrane protein